MRGRNSGLVVNEQYKVCVDMVVEVYQRLPSESTTLTFVYIHHVLLHLHEPMTSSDQHLNVWFALCKCHCGIYHC